MAALRLKKLIEDIDKKIFPHDPAPVYICRRKFRTGDYAAYGRFLPRGEDFYLVFVSGLHKALNKEKKVRLLFTGKKGVAAICLSRRPLVSFEPIIVGTACHEVRHRMQRRLKMRFFTPKPLKKRGASLLGNIVFATAQLFKMKKEDYMRKGMTKAAVKTTLDRREFDARVIEYMILQRFYRCRSLRKIIPLLRLQANVKTN